MNFNKLICVALLISSGLLNAQDKPSAEIIKAIQECGKILNINTDPKSGVKLSERELAALKECVKRKGFNLPPPPRPPKGH